MIKVADILEGLLHITYIQQLYVNKLFESIQQLWDAGTITVPSVMNAKRRYKDVKWLWATPAVREPSFS